MEKRCCIQFVELSNRRRLSKKKFHYDEFFRETRYDFKETLAPFLRKNAIDEVVAMLIKYDIVLRIETPRKEVLGSFRSWSNTIRINNNLDKDMFLSVFLHEVAHLITSPIFIKSQWHGAEFYYCYQELVLQFNLKNIISQDMILSIVNRSGDYESYRKYHGFKFQLKTIHIGFQVIYFDEVIVRGKGRNGLIECTKLSNNEKIKLDPQTKIVPVLDLNWQ